MKRLLAFIIAFTMLSGTIAFAGEEPYYTRYKSKEDEAWLWDELHLHCSNDAVVAGIIGYFWRESKYRSDAVGGWSTSLALYDIDLCKKVIRKTDKDLADGSSKKFFIKFVREHGGYGLGQWYSMGYLNSLYDFAQEYGTSIGDAHMQCAFIIHSLKQNKKLWKKLKKCKDPNQAGVMIAYIYDGTRTGHLYIGQKAERIYKKYHIEEDAA